MITFKAKGYDITVDLGNILRAVALLIGVTLSIPFVVQAVYIFII
jgi:hypothetical protein